MQENKNNQPNPDAPVPKKGDADWGNEVRSVTTGEVIPGVRIDAPVVSSLGKSAISKELMQAALNNSGADLKLAMDKAKADRTGQNWERTEDAQARARDAEAYAAAVAGRSDLAGSNYMDQSIPNTIENPAIQAVMDSANSANRVPQNPGGWERPDGTRGGGAQ